MAIAVQLDPEKAPTGCRVPTIVPVGEFYPGQAYEVTDEQGEALLALPDGPFMRASAREAHTSGPGKEPPVSDPRRGEHRKAAHAAEER